MPYSKRKYTRKRKPYKRKSVAWYEEKYSAKDIALKALQSAKYLKGLINSERHRQDAVIADNTPDTTGAIQHLTAISQGDAEHQRTGLRILLKSILVRGTLTINSAVATTYVRMIIFRDKQQVADSNAGVTDVLESASVQSFYNDILQHRFEILMDEVFCVNTGKESMFFSKYINKDIHIDYNGANTSDIQKNGIFALTLSDHAVNSPSFSVNTRLTWHDN